MAFSNIYKNKKVIITGNTGFKGTWLSTWLKMMGAEVYGYSIGVPTTPSMFDTLHLEDKICQHYGDIRNKREFNDFVQEVKPDFLIHLAAQALVLTSYREPFETMTTNIVGTAVVCEAVMNIDWNCTCVLITSDKAYDNVEWIWGYRETDGIGGKDMPNLSLRVIGIHLSRKCQTLSLVWLELVTLSVAVIGQKIELL